MYFGLNNVFGHFRVWTGKIFRVRRSGVRNWVQNRVRNVLRIHSNRAGCFCSVGNNSAKNHSKKSIIVIYISQVECVVYICIFVNCLNGCFVCVSRHFRSLKSLYLARKGWPRFHLQTYISNGLFIINLECFFLTICMII